jgi:uncharacterized protein YndB with AHSA1/START domain
MNTDRIEKTIVLRAPRERVWHAIIDSQQFGRWFGVEFEGPFVEGQRVKGKIVPTQVDTKVAEMQKPYDGMPCDFYVERIEPMRKFSYRWHPSAVEPGADYSKEPTTLIVFELEEVAEGTLLTITESGFDSVPLERRVEAFKSNEQGWEIQTKLIEKYLSLNS